MLAKALDAYGINGEEALAKCNIASQMVKDPDIRIPIDENNRAEQSHEATRVRERGTRRYR